jgi:predicted ABC-type ATPase
MKRRRRRPACIVIAGPNGAGKTTLAREYLPKVAGVIHLVNADLIAQGLVPLDPGLAAMARLGGQSARDLFNDARVQHARSSE